MNAGGWMGSIYILHASLTEYILFVGTVIDTSKNSGISIDRWLGGIIIKLSCDRLVVGFTTTCAISAYHC